MLNKNKCQGVIVPMVTPFTQEGNVDAKAVCAIAEHLIAGGMDGIFVLGTTGEAASISSEQKTKLVEVTVGHVKERAVVYAGISSNSLDESISAARVYVDLGADILVAHPPYFYPLSDEEIYSYFMKLADDAAGPLMIYNIPMTTGISISIEVAERLGCHERIVGLKDSERTEGRLEEAIERLCGRDDFSYVVGCAVLSAKAVGLGAAGIVPSSGNLEPGLYRSLFDNAQNGNESVANEFQEITNRVSKLYQENRSLSQSLAVLKAAMHIRGLCGPTVLPPLEALGQEDIAELKLQMAMIIES